MTRRSSERESFLGTALGLGIFTISTLGVVLSLSETGARGRLQSDPEFVKASRLGSAAVFVQRSATELAGTRYSETFAPLSSDPTRAVEELDHALVALGDEGELDDYARKLRERIIREASQPEPHKYEDEIAEAQLIGRDIAELAREHHGNVPPELVASSMTETLGLRVSLVGMAAGSVLTVLSLFQKGRKNLLQSK